MQKEEIKKIFEEAGFDLVGISQLSFNTNLNRYFESEKLGYKSNFIKGNPKDRINLKTILPDVKSVIAVGLTYTKDYPLIDKTKPHFGNSSWGSDYHLVIEEKANNAIKRLLEKRDFKYEIICDKSILDDRFFAYLAGLGWFGKNSLLINPNLGSYFFIGLILVDFEIKPDMPINNLCGDCELCIKACPNRALNDKGLLNSKKCRSQITQSKEEITVPIGNSIFGCDLCAKICPFNTNVNHQKNEEFLPTGIEQVDNVIELTNQEFKLKYGHLAGSYIGKNRIKRNIKYIKDNKNML